eukprot:1686416-Prymnesium_polylepis.1
MHSAVHIYKCYSGFCWCRLRVSSDVCLICESLNPAAQCLSATLSPSPTLIAQPMWMPAIASYSLENVHGSCR